ncbi:spore coat protein GerQ [Pseudogracilibacillus sp. SE30717A]|uniref:spore coat protein GerQ n=1 Tax=Pseudogracilibacillus sp. SE30717A TaxID=3098293 RepID=UPI00300E2497
MNNQQMLPTCCTPVWHNMMCPRSLSNMNNYLAGMQMQNQGNPMPEMSQTTPVSPSTSATLPGQLPIEQSFVENILRLNKGKLATVYMSFDGENNSTQTVFTGIIEAAGRDHLILSDPQTGTRYLLLMVYLNYVTFQGEIEYSYPAGQLATYSPR